MNYTGNPTQPIIAYACNSSYTTGKVDISPECQFVAAKFPSELQDDGTKFRGIFTKNLSQNLGDLGYILITSDSKGNNYYKMKTYGYLGSEGSVVQESTNNGISYSSLSDGYETELNINWFMDPSSGNNGTQFIARIWSNNSLGNSGNSSDQILDWLFSVLNEPPIVNIITPEINESYNGLIDVNWTTAEPNGDSYQTNITLSNGTSTNIIFSNLGSSNASVSLNTSNFSDGNWNLTVLSFENATSELYSFNDTHEIIIDNTNPSITSSTTTPSLPLNNNGSEQTLSVNFTSSEYPINITFNFYNSTGSLINTTTQNASSSSDIPLNFTIPDSISDGVFSLNMTATDNAGNTNITSLGNVTVTNPSSSSNDDSSSNGGGGSSNYLNEINSSTENLNLKVSLGKGIYREIYINDDKETRVSKLTIKTSNRILGNIKISNLNAKPLDCFIPGTDNPFKIYKILEIDSNLLESGIESLSLNIEVDKNWINSNIINEIFAIKCKPSFEKIDTEKIISSEDFDTYELSSNSFSTWVVLGNQIQNESNISKDVLKSQEIEKVGEKISNEDSKCCIYRICWFYLIFCWYIWIIILLVFIIMLVIGWKRRRNKIKKIKRGIKKKKRKKKFIKKSKN